jgi:hypothetical protein
MRINNKEIIELVGIFALVASLIFVGMQLLLDRRIAMSDQYFNRAESVKSDLRAELESEESYLEFEEMWALGERPPYWDENWDIARQVEEGIVSVSSIRTQILRQQLRVIGFDNIYYQYTQELIEEEFWLSFRELIKRDMTQSELVRALFVAYARPSIRPVIDLIDREIDAES